MAEHDPPPPLKTGADASPELVRALEALGRDTDAARLARVGAKLGPLLDVPAPSLPPAANWWQVALGKLSLTKLALSGGVLAAAAFALIQYPFAETSRPSAPPAPLEAPAVAPAEARSDRLAVAPPVAPSTDERARAATPSAEHATHATAKTAAPSKRSPRQAGPKPATSAARSQSSPSAQTSEPTEAAGPAAERAAAEVAEEPAAEGTKLAAKPIPPPPAATGAPPLSEADLLYGARKALAKQPAAALRLLDEHATRFQDGLLAPEREVLAIEALRNLGRTAEATKRLHQFKARYPKSIHLRRLQGKDDGVPNR